jgi:N-acetylmuramoyl-L-alanine amidase
MKLIAALAVSGVLLMGQSDKSAVRSITAVRHWSLESVTRVAVEVSGSFEYHTDRLHNPERVYYDIPNSHLKIDTKRFYTESVDDKLLEKIRIAENTPGLTRIVLDLSANVSATVSTLGNPDRLIVELRAQPGNPLRTDPPPTDPVPVVPPVLAVAVPPTPAAPVSIPMPVGPGPIVTAKTVIEPGSIPGLDRSRLAPLPAVPDPPATAATGDGPGVAPSPVGTGDSHAVPDPGPEAVAKAAHPTSEGTTSLVRALGLKLNRVVIDAGHGGHDEGTAGAHGLLEKELVLDVALRVGKLVHERLGAEVIYTRSDDTFVTLEGRTALANEKKADLFLSVHANSAPAFPKISGVETYYLNINGTKDAMDVASRENGPTSNSIFDLRDIVKKIAQHDKSEESHEFAKDVEASLFDFSLKNFPGTHDRGVKTAPFIVLIGANMPSVLAEIGFLSNAKEEALLKTPAYRQKLAEALYRGVQKYAESLSHFQLAERP